MIIPLNNPEPSPPRMYVFHALSGRCAPYLKFAAGVNKRISVYGVESEAWHSNAEPLSSVSAIALTCAHAVRSSASGPITLLGWSFGGLIAVEVARILEGMQQRPEHVFILDSIRLAADVGCDVDTPYGTSTYDPSLDHVGRAYRRALARYRPLDYGGPLTFFCATDNRPTPLNQGGFNRRFPQGKFTTVAADHYSMLEGEPLSEITRTVLSVHSGLLS